MDSLAATTVMLSAGGPLGFPRNVVAWMALAYHAVTTGVLHALHSVSDHTGIPVVLVAAVALVLSFRFARRGARLALEVAVALALVLLATKLGWIHW
jgi:predicted neutral ceramidase superfamily lipid hydrolase